MKRLNIMAKGMASLFVFAPVLASCSDENNEDATSNKSLTENSAQDNAKFFADKDSVFTVNHVFDYGDLGPSSQDNQSNGLNYNITDNQVVSRGGTLESVLTSVLKFGMTQATTFGVGTFATWYVDKVFGSEKDDLKQQIKEINSQVSKLTDYLKDLDGKLDNVEATELLRQRAKYDQFVTLTNSAFEDYFKTDDAATQKQIINKWAETSINSCAAYLTTVKFINFLCNDLNSQHMPMPCIYDYWVFQTTPWEHEGYETRNNMRLADAVTVICSTYMAMAYCAENGYDMTAKKVVQGLDNFCDVYTKNPVVRHDNQLVCQIKNAHVVLEKNLVTRDMEACPWMSRDYQNFDGFYKNLLYTESGVSSDSVLKKSITPDVAKAIYNYYNTGKKNSKKMTFMEIMQKVGFDTSSLQSGKTHVMTFNTGYSTAYSNDGLLSSVGHFFANYQSIYLGAAGLADDKDFIKDKYYVGDMDFSTSGMVLLRFNKWHKFDGNRQFFRTNMVKEYSGWQPFDK